MFVLHKIYIFALLCLGLLSCRPQSASPGFDMELPNPTAGTAPEYQVTATPVAQPFAGLSQDGNGNADVEYVRAVHELDGSWTFYVTVRHPDQGWKDYADGWDIILPDGRVLKPDPAAQFSRTLLHPHVNEQPFTRSLAGVEIPAGTAEVLVRAHDLVDGYGGQIVIVDFHELSGTKYSIESGR